MTNNKKTRRAKLVLHQKDNTGLARCICGAEMLQERSEKSISYRWKCKRQMELNEPSAIWLDLYDTSIIEMTITVRKI